MILKRKRTISFILCLIMALTCMCLPFGMMSNRIEAATTTATTTTKKTTTTTKKSTATTTSKPSTNAKMTVVSQPQQTTLVGTNKTTINYTVTNTGNTTFTNVKLMDKDIAGTKVLGTADSLAAGASKNFSYEATFSRSSNSQPTVTGTANGKSLSFTGEKKTISVGASTLGAVLSSTTSSPEAGKAVNFSLKLTNKGSSSVSNIKVTDAAGASLKDNITLSAGESKDITFDKTFNETAEFYVLVKGKDGSGGDVSTESNKVSIKMGETSVDEDAIIEPENGISLVIQADKTELDKAQKVKLTMEIHNLLKDQGYKDITIIDKATKKEITKIDSLAADEQKTLESEVDVKETTTFLYTIKATADDGTQLEIDSNSMVIKVGKGVRNSSFIIFLIIFIIIVLLLIGTGIALFVISRKNKKKKQAGTPYSNKYKNKVVSDNLNEPELEAAKVAPLSTFSIDDNNDTMPINIPQQSSDFSASDYDQINNTIDSGEVGYDPNTPLDEVLGKGGSDETRPLHKPFQTIDYDDLDPDKH